MNASASEQASLLSNYARLLALLGWLGLVISLGVALGWAGIVAALPLLFPLPGLCRAQRYTYAWCSLLVLFYIAYAMTEFVASREPFLVLPALLSSMALFSGCVLFVRLRTRELNNG